MKKFYCQECELNFDKPMIVKGRSIREACPRCMNEDFEWANGYESVDYWRTAYWQLKEKHNKLLDSLKD